MDAERDFVAKLNHIRDQQFVERELVLDGNLFTGCSFVRCTLIYYGGPTRIELLPPDKPTFTKCQFKFRESAGRTFKLLNYLGGIRSEYEGQIESFIFHVE